MSRKAEQRLDQLAVVPLVETDGRLVEHVEDADETAADLRREADPLRLTAGQRRRRAVEAQVVEPDVDEELQPAPGSPSSPARRSSPRASVSSSLPSSW